jgi:hypothetical protein
MQEMPREYNIGQRIILKPHRLWDNRPQIGIIKSKKPRIISPDYVYYVYHVYIEGHSSSYRSSGLHHIDIGCIDSLIPNSKCSICSKEFYIEDDYLCEGCRKANYSG